MFWLNDMILTGAENGKHTSLSLINLHKAFDTNKTNAKSQFLYRQNEFLNPKLRRLLCKSLIQTHFD